MAAFKNQLVSSATWGKLQLKGNAKKKAMLKKPVKKSKNFFLPLKVVLGTGDPKYLDTAHGFDWCAVFVYYAQ